MPFGFDDTIEYLADDICIEAGNYNLSFGLLA